jgi:hypothetical protein
VPAGHVAVVLRQDAAEAFAKLEPGVQVYTVDMPHVSAACPTRQAAIKERGSGD